MINLENKDELYYADLTFEVKRIAGLQLEEDEETIKRIQERLKDKKVNENGMICYEPSEFQLELFSVIQNVSKIVGKRFKSISNISEYPDVVMQVLEGFNEEKKLEKTRK